MSATYFECNFFNSLSSQFVLQLQWNEKARVFELVYFEFWHQQISCSTLRFFKAFKIFWLTPSGVQCTPLGPIDCSGTCALIGIILRDIMAPATLSPLQPLHNSDSLPLDTFKSVNVCLAAIPDPCFSASVIGLESDQSPFCLFRPFLS